MLASVRSLRALQPRAASRSLASRSSTVPALVAARQNSHAFSTKAPLNASQSPDTFMNGTNASYAQAQFEAWQEASLSELFCPFSRLSFRFFSGRSPSAAISPSRTCGATLVGRSSSETEHGEADST